VSDPTEGELPAHDAGGAEEPAQGAPTTTAEQDQRETPTTATVEPDERAAETPVAEDHPSDSSTSAPAEAPSPEGKPAKPPKPRLRHPALVRAWRSRRPVEGEVAQVIKGGYEVRLGKARAFCPHSQIERHRENEPERHVGQKYTFLITQIRRGGEDIVVSRRAVLTEAQADEAKALRAALVEGQVVRGRVAGVADFGAFIDLGAGVMGLAHISELSHQRIQKVEDAVHGGDEVLVRILKIAAGEQGKISLSVRRAVPDPWSEAAERFGPGQQVQGKVTRLADFGAFVEIAPGVEALAPASELPPSPGGWQAELAPGTERSWQILSVDARRRRISLTLPGDTPLAAIEPEATLDGRVQRVESYGVFVWLGPGKVGLMPKVWSGTPPGTDLGQAFPIGRTLTVRVVEIADEGRRIRLAVPGARTDAEASGERKREHRPRERDRDRNRERDRDREREREQAREPEPEPQGAFGTSLADKLRDALSSRRSNS
jgi:small subunit ribosomal protein S1